jgi:hypothetical protein
MSLFRIDKLAHNWEEKALPLAIALVLCTVGAGMARADVTRVEALEFKRVQLLGANELEITQGEVNAMKIRGDADDLKPPPFVVQGDTLRLGVTAGGDTVSDVKYKLSVTAVTEILLEGSGDVYVKPLTVGDLLVAVEGSGVIHMFDLKAQDLELRVVGSGAVLAVEVSASSARLNLKGSGDIQLGSLAADTIKAHMAGSGDVTVQDGGSANALEVGVMGSGDVAMKGLSAKTAKVTIMGSGDVEVRVAESLEAEILGSGDLVYYGKPSTSTSIMGSGDITQRDGS